MRLFTPDPPPKTLVFGRRLKAARQSMGLAQDKLGVLVGLDESTASARMSRYENGIHEPPIKTAQLLAAALGVPLAYLYCEEDRLANLILKTCRCTDDQWRQLGLFIDAMLVMEMPTSEHRQPIYAAVGGILSI